MGSSATFDLKISEIVLNPLLISKEHERTRLEQSETKLERQMLVRQQQLAGSPPILSSSSPSPAPPPGTLIKQSRYKNRSGVRGNGERSVERGARRILSATRMAISNKINTDRGTERKKDGKKAEGAMCT
ncbi:uncharacterized protein LOC113564140 [Drosophila erecta]|uniref:uncharacterized protein LOC113564140 n=1 Tax=Drosophila erecta TaxID=7220 RepID=UPI000F07269F|nr:uncharacterized protein LOC113564140 [Drosophila erecta]